MQSSDVATALPQHAYTAAVALLGSGTRFISGHLACACSHSQHNHATSTGLNKGCCVLATACAAVPAVAQGKIQGFGSENSSGHYSGGFNNSSSSGGRYGGIGSSSSYSGGPGGASRSGGMGGSIPTSFAEAQRAASQLTQVGGCVRDVPGSWMVCAGGEGLQLLL